MKLTKEDKHHLKSLNDKYKVIRDRVTLCAEGYGYGAYVWGEGGIGKSYAVIDQLKNVLGLKPVIHNTRLSGPAFFASLEKHPKEKDIHLVEDVENIFTERTTMNLLRSALWGQKDKKGKRRRWVTYGVHPVERIVEFEGVIFFTGNRALSDIPELRALATRIPTLHLNVAREEILALMKQICQEDWVSDKGTLPQELCDEVLEHFLSVYPDGRVYDIRILERSLDDRLGFLNLGDKLATSWQTQILSQLTGKLEPPVTRKDRISQEKIIALELAKRKLTKTALLKEWSKQTGHETLDSYYRRLRELQ